MPNPDQQNILDWLVSKLDILVQRAERSPLTGLESSPNFDPALRTEDAAEYCGIHSKTLLKDARAGKVAFCKRHSEDSGRGRLRFRLSDLNEYLKAQRNERASFQVSNKEIDWGSI